MRVIFAAGGTGGHLYPALALADYMSTKSSDILFVGSNYRMEAEKVPEYGYSFTGLDIKTPSGSIFNKVKGYFDVFNNVKNCEKIIKEFKPDVVIGFGGYTSYPLIKAAINLNVPAILHEQNSVIGRSNRVLANKVDAIISAYDISDQLKSKDNLHILGNPTSYHVKQKSAINLNDYGLSNSMKTILVVMGSQGSQIIDNMMYEILQENESLDYQIIYVSGEAYYDRYSTMDLLGEIRVLPYHNNLVGLIKSCDLIVSRAGASALTEIISANKPAILIPSIHVTNNHQVKNAENIAQSGAAIVISEDAKTKENLINTMNELIKDEQRLVKMSAKTSEFNFDDSAMMIDSLIKTIVGEYNEK